ncbi:MAG TPA: CopG family antitoxin [Pyrinomonadaceae bacterium]|nr:CopG family antitoxin [Pyrinomonadaceae bacterium]
MTSDKQVEGLLDGDLTGYLNTSNFTPMTFEFEAKDKVVNLRMSQGLFERVRDEASRRKIPYQRFIRQALEKAVKS